MKPTSALEKLGASDPEEAFKLFVSTFRPSLKLWNYFVNWDKVFRNTRAMEVDLNVWNYLIGKENFEAEFLHLLKMHPEIVRVLPSLVVRDGADSKRFAVVNNIDDLQAGERFFDFSTPAVTEGAREQALQFVVKSGLVKLFQKDGVKNLVDYVLGVEAGLDSNGRKNRSGSSMEIVVGAYLEKFTAGRGLRFISQATPKVIEKEFGFIVPVDKSSRRFDFAVSDGTTLVLIEVNFYGGGGSKLKSTAGEYKELGTLLNVPNVKFVWITDGAGWLTTLAPLRSAFDKLDYVWNLFLLHEESLDEFFPATTAS